MILEASQSRCHGPTRITCVAAAAVGCNQGTARRLRFDHRPTETRSTFNMATLQFSPLASTILPEFWTSLSKLKVDELKLSQHPIPIRGSYGPGRSVVDKTTGQQLSLGTSIHFDGDAFEEQPVASTSYATRV